MKIDASCESTSLKICKHSFRVLWPNARQHFSDYVVVVIIISCLQMSNESRDCPKACISQIHIKTIPKYPHLFLIQTNVFLGSRKDVNLKIKNTNKLKKIL